MAAFMIMNSSWNSPTGERKPAIFFDRDGTLIEDVGILREPAQICLFPDTIEALYSLGNRYQLFVVSNQPGISRGDISLHEVEGINLVLDDIFRKNGIHIREWFVCPHTRSDQCKCIKPNSFFLKQAAEKYHLDLTSSFFIGDHPHDVLTGDELGVIGLYLLTGHGIRHLGEVPADRLVFHSLSHMVRWIQKHPTPRTDLLQAIENGANCIKAGGLVAFPTETVYGLGADAFNPQACLRVFESKRRPLHNPLIVHISDPEQIDLLASDISPVAHKLMDRFWPGPLSLIFRKKTAVPDIVTAGQQTVAVRMPDHPIASALIRRAATPIAAPSANVFGRTSATSAQHVLDQLQDVCDVMIDGGSCRIGVESTVVSVTKEKPVVLRPGAISLEELEATAEISFSQIHDHPNTNNLQSPGMMSSHYQTETPLYLVDNFSPFSDLPGAGFLVFGKTEKSFAGPVRNLSASGDLKEAAVNLYAAMRELDTLDLQVILAKLLPETGIGHAINNRLRKASRNLKD